MNPFDLTGRLAIITGGGGLLGYQHALAIAGAGGIPVLADIREEEACRKAASVEREFGVPALGVQVDITDAAGVHALLARVLDRFGRVDILVNNAARDPKVSPDTPPEWARLETFPLAAWEDDLAVGLTGAFLCCQVIGTEMARRGKGVILNVASDLALISPDQRLYRRGSLPEERQPVKPVSYPVVKSALVGLTRYLATYWAPRGVRVNAISPGGVYANQPDEFVARLAALIPMARMARVDEYRGAIVFLCSDASSYMTGANVVIDGGRTVW